MSPVMTVAEGVVQSNAPRRNWRIQALARGWKAEIQMDGIYLAWATSHICIVAGSGWSS